MLLTLGRGREIRFEPHIKGTRQNSPHPAAAGRYLLLLVLVMLKGGWVVGWVVVDVGVSRCMCGSV